MVLSAERRWLAQRAKLFKLNVEVPLVQDRRSEPSTEQLRNLRQRAAEARRCAASSRSANLRQAYEELAAAWELLVREVESNS